MQDATQQPGLKIVGSGRTTWFISIGFLIFVLILAGVLYGANYMAQRSTAQIKMDTDRLNMEVQKASADSKIVIAKILNESGIRPSIDLKNIVTQFRLAAIQANVEFDGFSIKDDIITTNLTSRIGTDAHPDAVGTIIAMMNKYSLGDQAFALGSINSVAGDTGKRTTTIELRVLAQPIQ